MALLQTWKVVTGNTLESSLWKSSTVLFVKMHKSNLSHKITKKLDITPFGGYGATPRSEFRSIRPLLMFLNSRTANLLN